MSNLNIAFIDADTLSVLFKGFADRVPNVGEFVYVHNYNPQMDQFEGVVASVRVDYDHMTDTISTNGHKTTNLISMTMVFIRRPDTSS